MNYEGWKGAGREGGLWTYRIDGCGVEILT